MLKLCAACSRPMERGNARCPRCTYTRPDSQPIRRQRRAFLARHSMCVRCGATTDLTVDHITPLAHGGTDHQGNWQTLCRSCNARKNDRV